MKVFQILKVMFFVLLIWTEAIYAGTYYVDVNGDNSNGDGSERHPWRTAGYAVGHVRSGDTVSINDGIYSEFQIVLPEGVSLTSTSKDSDKVIIQPAESMKMLINLKSYGKNRDGNQEVSFLQLNGTSGSHHAQIGIDAKDRNNLRIHHNNIHDFDTGSRFCFGIRVRSSEEPSGCWVEVWPIDPGVPGDDSSLDAAWPSNPVKNLEINHNEIVNCGRKDDSMAPYGGLWLYNIKDSSIHDNYIDNTSNFGECIFSTPAYFDNVDIYNNTLRMATLSSRSSYIIEIWMFRGGCKFYSNDADAGFSIAVGKETEIYNNIIKIPDPHFRGGYGIEFTGQTFGEVYNNYIYGASVGMGLGLDTNMDFKPFWIRETTAKRNVIINSRKCGIRILSTGESGTKVENFKIYNNTIDGNVHPVYALFPAIQDNAGIMNNIEIKNNILINAVAYPLIVKGDIDAVVLESNLLWSGGSKDIIVNAKGINTMVQDPRLNYVKVGEISLPFLSNNSPCINAGAVMDANYLGIGPDIGAIEYGQTEWPSMKKGIEPPENVEVSPSPS